MTGVGNLVVLAVFAWAVRGLLSARELGWARLTFAVLGGYIVGSGIGLALLVDVTNLRDPAALQAFDERIGTEGFGSLLWTVSLPFQVIATMIAVVLLELVRPRPPRRRQLRAVRPLRAVTRRVEIAARMVEVSRIVARHGLAPVLGLRRGEVPARDPVELARRVRTALEDAGGVFVKLGQLLATRPDLVPPEVLAELGRLHATARPLSAAEVRTVVADDLARLTPHTTAGDRPTGTTAARSQPSGATAIDAVFAAFEDEPLGSASIAQAHVARLHDGREVVVKVRRPGLEDVVERDLAIMLWLARTAERRTGWGRAYEVTALAGEFADALRAELDFRNEARRGEDLATALEGHDAVRAPRMLGELTTDGMLVMERLDGRPLSSVPREELDASARALADALCASQVGAMLQGQRFHGDPHPGNVMLLDDGRLGLIDFGVTGKLDAFERSAMLQLLVAIRLQEPTLLYESLVAVGAIDPGRAPDDIERALARWMAAHLVPGLPSADALTELLRLTTELGIRLPAQATTMFRALATLAGTLEQLSPGYPLIDRVADQAGIHVADKVAPSSVSELVQREWAQLGPLLRRAPRHLDRIATMIEQGGVTARVRLFSEPEDARVVERWANRAILTVLALGVCGLAVMMLGTEAGPSLEGTDIRLLEVLGWAGLFAGTVLLLRVLLDLLRSEQRRT